MRQVLKRPQGLALAAAAASLVGGGWIFWLHGNIARSPDRVPSALTAARGPAVPKEVAAKLAVPTGVTPIGYRFQRRIQAQSGARELVDLQLQGRLWVGRVAEVGVWEFTFQIDSPETLKDLPRLRVHASPGQPIPWVELADSARARDLEAQSLVSRVGVDLLQQYFFFESWDLQGPFQAKLHRADDRHFTKTKLRYTQAPYAGARIRDSQNRLELDDQHVLQEVSGEESIALGEGEMELTSETNYLIRRDPRLDAEGLAIGRGAWLQVAFNADLAQSSAGRQLASATALDGIPSLHALVGDLKSGNLKTTSERMGNYRGLVKRLDSDPSLAAEAQQALLDLKARPAELSIIVGALASSRQDAAQAALRNAFKDESFPPAAHDLILTGWAITDVALPSETVDLLRQVATSGRSSVDPAAQGALLALGAQAAKVSESERVKIEGLLSARLKEASTNGERIAALDSIGNSSSLKLFPDVRDYLGDTDAQVRGHAYLALRRMPGDEILQTIEGGRTDASDEVRHSVELALNLRTSGS